MHGMLKQLTHSTATTHICIHCPEMQCYWSHSWYVQLEMSTCRNAGRGPREGIARLGLPGGLARAGDCAEDCTAAQGLLAAAGVAPAAAAAAAASGADAARLNGSTLSDTATRGCATSKMATCRDSRSCSNSALCVTARLHQHVPHPIQAADPHISICYRSKTDGELHTWSPCVSSCIGSVATSPLTRTRTHLPPPNRPSLGLAPDSSAATVVPAGTCTEPTAERHALGCLTAASCYTDAAAASLACRHEGLHDGWAPRMTHA